MVAISALFTDVNTDTAAILVLLLPILVANADDTVANSALVAKSSPSTTVLILVMAAVFVAISALLTEVNTDTAAMFVFELPIEVASAADTVANSADVA